MFCTLAQQDVALFCVPLQRPRRSLEAMSSHPPIVRSLCQLPRRRAPRRRLGSIVAAGEDAVARSTLRQLRQELGAGEGPRCSNTKQKNWSPVGGLLDLDKV